MIIFICKDSPGTHSHSLPCVCVSSGLDNWITGIVDYWTTELGMFLWKSSPPWVTSLFLSPHYGTGSCVAIRFSTTLRGMASSVAVANHIAKIRDSQTQNCKHNAHKYSFLQCPPAQCLGHDKTLQIALGLH